MTMATPQATYTNPVWDHNFPDPLVVNDQGTYYAFATQRDEHAHQVITSKDLVHWKKEKSIPAPAWATGQLWAPEVHKWKGKWYLFCSGLDKDSKKRDLTVAVADKPTGPYTYIAKLIPGASENPTGTDEGAIDPTVFIEKGVLYLLYIREAVPRAIKIVRLSDDLKSTIGEPKVVITITRDVEQGILDAPTMIKRNGTYYLLFSTGWFQSDNKNDSKYQIWAATSKSLIGPYAKPDKPVLTGVKDLIYSPGHQCVFRTSNGDWWIGYHAWSTEGEPRYGSNPKGRTFRIDRLKWTSEGPQAVGPTLSPQPIPVVK